MLTWIRLFKNYIKFWGGRQISLDETNNLVRRRNVERHLVSLPSPAPKWGLGPFYSLGHRWRLFSLCVTDSSEDALTLSWTASSLLEMLRSSGFPLRGSSCKCLSAGPSGFQELSTRLGSTFTLKPWLPCWLASSQDVSWKCPDSRGRKYVPGLQASFLAVLNVSLQLWSGIFWRAHVLVNTWCCWAPR